MNSFGETIRKLRKDKKLPLRTVSDCLDIDPAILSKIERGQRKANRALVIKLAGFFNLPENDLLLHWLSDKLVYEISNEEIGLKALQVAEERISYTTAFMTSRADLINNVRAVLDKAGRVAEAWIFGSFAKGDNTAISDIDIMVELNKNKKYSIFDLLDIRHAIESKIEKKVDLVEKGYLKDFAARTADKSKIKIYG